MKNEKKMSVQGLDGNIPKVYFRRIDIIKKLLKILYWKKKRMTSDLSSETMQSGRQWNNDIKVLKEKTCQVRILYSQKISLFYFLEQL